MPTNNAEQPTANLTERPQTSSGSSCNPSLLSVKTPRTARFAEATSINSPIEAPSDSRTFSRQPPTNHYQPQPQPGDIGFGYINEKHFSDTSVEMEETENQQLPRAHTPGQPLLSPPLKSALKTPGTAPRNFSKVLSPRFDEEQRLEEQEALTEKEQARDLRIKTRVRMAKFFLRGINFSCSLIVLSMLSASFQIFNATKAIPPRSTLPPWAVGTNPWAQYVLLVIACISLLLSIIVFYSYWRGGHRRAEKAAVYYTVFAIAFFVFNTIMWGIGAGVLNTAKTSGGGSDLWGWSCKRNKRFDLFKDVVDYELICRLQNWSLVCCIIEIIVETLTIAIYSVIFYRYYTKRRLRKSMASRDRARSDLYLAQLRSQSAPNTPGMMGPYSARQGSWKPAADPYEAGPEVEAGGPVQYIDASKPSAMPRPFILQPPPIKIQGATPKIQQTGFTPIPRGTTPHNISRTPSPPSPLPQSPNFAAHEQRQEHFGAAPGEQVYEAVPIPGAYAAPMASPTTAPRTMSFPNEGR